MSIPLDRLYHYIESAAQQVYGDTIIYRFWPHGSKKIEDLMPYIDYQSIELLTRPQVFCNDQEPLNFKLYQNHNHYRVPARIQDTLHQPFFKQNIRKHVFNIFDRCILVHSEKNSSDLLEYINAGFEPVYYWSHALIALDWFRYAKHVTKESAPIVTDFLVYNRAWGGTREYRLKFADLLVEHNLVKNCKTSLQFCDNQTHYQTHRYQNIAWKPVHTLENYFTENITSPCYSADFDIFDYQATQCEIVLETLFDTPRLHLTEKILRPIALGQPFLLCAPAGSLQYLRDYGFKTFNSVISEDYDLIADPVSRLNAVIETMKTISHWTVTEKEEKFKQMQDIAKFNKHHFFSDNFLNLITTELKINLRDAIQKIVQSNTFDRCINLNQCTVTYEDYINWQSKYIQADMIVAHDQAYKSALILKNSINK